jgi:hypothetical protein
MILAGRFPKRRPAPAADASSLPPAEPDDTRPDVPQPRSSGDPAHQLRGPAPEDSTTNLE